MLCRSPYHRPNNTVLLCQYLVDHPATHHSWWTCQIADETEVEQRRLRDHAASLLDTTPAGAQALLDAVLGGEYDQWLEALLAAGHNRKRAVRGVRGFTLARLNPQAKP